MSQTPRILAFGGSLRAASWNQQAVALAAAGAREAGADVTLVSLRDFPLPIFDQDLEEREGMPEKARELKRLFAAHDGLLIASPEYNSSVTAALKNAIDWVSRTESDDEPALSALRGKSAVILAASPGGYGGLRGLVHLRAILGNLGITVLPDQLAIPRAHEAFDDHGATREAGQGQALAGLGAKLARHLAKVLA